MKVKNNKKKLLILIMTISIIVIVSIISNSRGIQQQEFSTDGYSVKYDTTWKIKSSNENEVIFQHIDTNSTIELSIAELDTSMYGKTLKQVANNIKSKIECEYPNYKCITEKTTILNNNINEVYQILFEDGTYQSLIQVGMHGYKVFISNYTAKNKYFDILLDSAQTINYSFKISDKVIDLMDTRDIETTGINYKSDDVDYSNVSEYKYNGSYYKVRYTIPVQYTEKFVKGIFYKDNNPLTSTIEVNIRADNIFSVYDSDIKKIKSNNHIDIKVDKVYKWNLNGYCYSYKVSDDREYYKYLYVIDNYNTLEVTFVGNDITQNLIDNVKIIDYERSGTYIDRTTRDGFYEDELRYVVQNYTNNEQTSMNVKYKVPQKYKEIIEPTGDVGAPETGRAFVYGKLRNNEITESEWETDDFYDYNITISITYGGTDTIANKNNLMYQRDIQVGDNVYRYYTSQYDSEGTNIKEAYLLTDIKTANDNAKYSYEIYVTSLDDIPISVLQDFANVSIYANVLK